MERSNLQAAMNQALGAIGSAVIEERRFEQNKPTAEASEKLIKEGAKKEEAETKKTEAETEQIKQQTTEIGKQGALAQAIGAIPANSNSKTSIMERALTQALNTGKLNEETAAAAKEMLERIQLNKSEAQKARATAHLTEMQQDKTNTKTAVTAKQKQLETIKEDD